MTTPVVPFPVYRSEGFEVRSESVGDTFAIGVIPPMLPTTGEPPLLVYVLDGSLMLAAAAMTSHTMEVDLVRPGFPQLLLVGIDYVIGQPNCRSRDYTMQDAVPEEMRTYLELSPSTTPGGADAFLRFLEDELDPLIRSRYEVNAAPAGILGDSFGGTFTFHAFVQQSRLFDRYWLGSPGIFTTDTDHVAAFASVLSSPLVHDTRMFLSLGELEATGGIAQYEDMGAHFHRMLEALESTPNAQLTSRSRIYPGHTHTSVVGSSLSDALLWLYGER